jgi:hypothetical protein
MKQDEIIEMARQAGAEIANNAYYPFFIEELETFAKLVEEKATEKANAKANASWTLMCEKMVAFEREACAKLADEYATWGGSNFYDWFKKLAAAIRARGEQA